MIRKTLKHSSSGSLGGGINYVLSDTNSKNELRPTPPKILIGDKDALLEIEKDMTSKHTYVHSVLSFTTEEAENLTDDDKLEIAQSYIEQLAAGLPSSDRLAVLAVDHGDDMHFLCTRCDIETGKSYQPYVQPRGDAHRFELWNEAMQEQHDALIDPNDPSLVKLSKTGSAHPKEHESKGALRDQVLDDISARFAQKEFNNRDDIVDYLKNRDDIKIERITNKSISISSTTNTDMQNIRLKGALFEDGWPRIDGDFKAERAKPKVLQPTLELAKKNAELKEIAIKKYGEKDDGKKQDLLKPLQKNNEKLNDITLRHNVVNELKDKLDNNVETLNSKIENADWKHAIQSAKSYNAQDAHTNNEIISTASFIKKCDEFLQNYDDYMLGRNENKPYGYQATDKEIKEDNAWLDMHRDAGEAIENLTDFEMSEDIDHSNDDVDNGKDKDITNLQSLENELKQLENNMQQQETSMKQETTKEQGKESQKTQRRASSGGGRQAPKPVNIMAAVVAAWKQGEMETKRNDARNYSIAKKTMAAADNKPAPRKKSKKKKKNDD